MKKLLSNIILWAGAALMIFGLYRLIKILIFHFARGYEASDFGLVVMYVMTPLIPGTLMVLIGRRMKRGTYGTGAYGAILGPNGEKLTFPSEETNQCGFCGTVMPRGATVCSSCNAQKGIGRVGKFGVVGKGAVWPMRIMAILGWIVVLACFAVASDRNIGGYIYGGFIGLIMLAITLFNFRVIFWNGDYRWYRRGL